MAVTPALWHTAVERYGVVLLSLAVSMCVDMAENVIRHFVVHTVLV